MGAWRCEKLVTGEVGGELAVAEPSGRCVGDVIPPIRKEVGFDYRLQIVVVSDVNYGISEYA